MQDFLSRILDRSLQRAPVLQRRRRSMFEPEVPSAGPLALEEESTERIARPATARGPEWKADVESVTPKDAPIAATPERDRIHRAAHDEPDARAVSPLNSVSLDEAKPAHRSAPPKPAPVGANSQPVPFVAEHHTTEHHTVSQFREVHVERERIVERTQPATAASLRSSAPILPTPPTQAPAQPRGLSPAQFETGPMKETAVPVPIAGPPPVAIPDWARNATPKTATQASLPPVQINIGRIEVRASQGSSAAPAAPRPTAPRLSLEEYLRGRSRGRP